VSEKFPKAARKTWPFSLLPNAQCGALRCP
jgi:hypothetical protein